MGCLGFCGFTLMGELKEQEQEFGQELEQERRNEATQVVSQSRLPRPF